MGHLVRAGRAAAVIAATLFTVALTVSYVRREHFIHTWDHGVFHELALGTYAGFVDSPLAGIAFVTARAKDDYTAYFAVPLVPFLAAFGESRLGYVLSVALAFHLPLALALGRLGARLIDASPAATAWSTTAVALFMPIGWVPLLRGYPDSLSALLTVLAALAYLEDPGLRRAWQHGAIAILAASAIVIRRHYVTTVPLLLVAMAIATVALAWAGSRAAEPAARRALRWAALRQVTVLAASCVVGMLVIGRSFIARYAAHDYYAMYSGYLTPMGVVADYYAQHYGLATVVLAPLGLALGLVRGRLRRGPALFLGLFGAFVMTSWLVFVRQIGEQYTLHLLPFVVLGLTTLGFAVFLEIRSAARWLVPPLAAACLAASLFFGLAHHDAAKTMFPLRGLMPANWGPPQREDLAELRSLVALLREKAGPQEPVLVVASSLRLNPDLLHRAEMAFHGWRDTNLYPLPMAEIDTRDAYPLASLVAARRVVVARPLQLHLEPDQQRMLAAVHAMFESGADIASDFERLPRTFALDGGVEVAVYRRLAPSTIAHGLATLRRLEDVVPHPSSLQLEWVVVSASEKTWVARSAHDTILMTLPATPRGREPQTGAVFLPHVTGPLRLAGGITFLNRECPGAELILTQAGPDAEWREGESIVRRPGENGNWTAAMTLAPGRRLGIRLTVPEGQDPKLRCLIDVEIAVKAENN